MLGQMDRASQMNQWIALTAELEETRFAIAKTIFKHFKAGRIYDDFAIDLCRKLDDLYKDAKNYEGELQEDFKVYTEADANRGQGVANKAKATAANLITRWYISYNVNAYKRHFKDQYMELGARAVQSHEDGRNLCEDPQVVKMCRYAIRLKKDADMRWEEIEILSRENKMGNGFIGALQQFVTNLAMWGRSHGIPGLKQAIKVDENTTRKIREEYRKKFQGGDEK